MTTYYVKVGGSNAANGLTDATAWATPQYAELTLRGSTASHKVLLKCGDTWTAFGLRMSMGGTSKLSCAEWGAYYLSGGVETEGVSGVAPILESDYGPNMLAGASFTSGIYYPPPKNAQNGRWYRAEGSGTFPATFPALTTTIGATQVINGVSFTVFESGPATWNTIPYNTGIFNRSTSDTANFIRWSNIILRNSRGMGWRNENEVTPATPTLNYFELINVEFDNCSHSAYQTAKNESVNVEWLIDGIKVHYCGKAARDGNFAKLAPGRPAFVRHRGATNTTVSRILKNFIFTRNWQEVIISSPQNLVQDGVNHAAYVHWYLIGDFVTGAVRDNIIERVLNIGTADAYNNRYPGYSGYSFWFANEVAGAADILANTVRNCCSAFTAGLFHIGNRAIAPGSVFDYTSIIFCTSIDDRLPFDASSTTGHTGGVIKNNAFIHKTAGLAGYVNGVLGGIDCDYNYWTTQAMAGNAAGAHDVYGDVDGLAYPYKESGWQNIDDYPEVGISDFRPSAASSLFGRGIAISGITTDISGATRANPPTIGAWETAYDDPIGGGGDESTVPTLYKSDTKFGYGAAGTGRTVARPSNLATGDLVLLEFHTPISSATSGTNISNLDAGFESAGSSRGTGDTIRPEATIWLREVADILTEPAVYTFDSSQAYMVAAHRINGHKPGDISDFLGSVSSVDSGATGVTGLTIPGITTAAVNSLLFSCIGTRNNSVSDFSAGSADEVYERIPNGSVMSAAAYAEMQAPAGASGDKTITAATNTSRMSAIMIEILAGTASVDIAPPVNTVVPYVSAKSDTSFTLTFTLTDATTTNIRADAVATRTCFPRSSVPQVFAHADGNDLDATDFASKTDVASGVSNTLVLDTGLVEPKYNWAFAARDNAGSPNTQLAPVTGTVLLDPPSGFEYTEVTIDSGASADSVLAGLTFSIGDVIVYPSATTEDALPIDIDGAGLINITRGGNTNTQTFNAYLWSQSTGNTQAITFQDPFYQSPIGPFGNNTDTMLKDTTCYVVAALDENDDGDYTVPAHKPLRIQESVAAGVAVAVSLDSDGMGIFYNTVPGKYHGDVYNQDGTYMGKLGANGTIGITVA